MKSISIWPVMLVMVLVIAVPLSADTIKLVNGDQLTGKVVSIDDQQIVLQSPVLGKVTLPRKEVVQLQLGTPQRPPAPTARSPQRVAPKPGAPGEAAPQGSTQPAREGTDGKPAGKVSEARLLKELRSRGLPIKSLADLKGLMPQIQLPNDQSQTPEDVVRQLRTQGIGPAALDDVQAKVPLLVVPGVRSYFEETLQGLISGRVGLQDIRGDAIKARDGLLDIKKDLGPSGEALNGYLMILEDFIKQTENARSVP